MTFDEMQQIIQGMLAVQQELQVSQVEMKQTQISFQASLQELRDDIAAINERGRQYDRRLEQLIGYSITGETDRLDLLERLQRLERRVNRLEQDNNGK